MLALFVLPAHEYSTFNNFLVSKIGIFKFIVFLVLNIST